MVPRPTAAMGTRSCPERRYAMGEIADDLIEAEARGQDYESYMMDLATEAEEEERKAKRAVRRVVKERRGK
jgi:hypothetical protein